MATQFRILTGSYEHNLLCLSLVIPADSKSPVFQPIFHFESHSLSIYCISSSHRYLVTGLKDEHIKIYDLQKRKELGDLLAHEGSVNTLKFSANGKWLLSGAGDHSIIVWGVQDWDVFGKLKGHKGAVTDLAIHPSSRIALSCSEDNTIRLWNLMTAKKAAAMKMKYAFAKAQRPQFVRWSLDGEYFVVGLSTRLLIYKTSSAKIVRILEFKSPIMHIEIYQLKEGEHLVLGLGNAAIWFYNWEQLVKDQTDEEIPEALQVDPDFKLIGHASRVKDFKLFKPENSESVFFVSVSSDGKIVVWNMDTKDQVAIYDAGERLNCVEVVAESVEKADSMKKRELEEDPGFKTESEYETDGEGSKKILFGGKSKKKRAKKKAKKAKIEVE